MPSDRGPSNIKLAAKTVILYCPQKKNLRKKTSENSAYS